ncbi:MAG: alpha/beta fold hydrolase [Pseudonocardiaceae bacterium]
MADDAVGLLDALGLYRAHVVGASLGGMIAQMMAITYPERVRATTDKPRGGGGVDRGIPEDHRLTRLPDGRGLGP